MDQDDELLRSAEELCIKAERHRRLMCGNRERPRGNHNDDCICDKTILKLRQAICESISVIEDTRSSFKSKRLEILRKKLMRTLAEE